jgi:choline dehydrogenase-like flavoprotein
MIRDLEAELPTTPQSTDVCIVGAGAAGILLALDLARQGRHVTLLEGGGRDIEEPSQEPYASEVVGQPHRGIHVGRFRAHGGTTRRWGGQILELDDIDFAQRDWIPGSGWPLTRQQLAPFYQRALQLEGVAGSIPDDTAVWRALSQTPPVFPQFEPFFTRWCPDPDFTRLHRTALETNPRIEIWLHANAVSLTLEGERVHQVNVRTLDGRAASFTAAHFVFCLGAIESSRFFLQPRDGQLPWNHSGLLGKHFHDHIDCNAARIEPLSPAHFHALFDNVFLRGYKYHPKLKLSPTAQQEQQTLHTAATMNFLSDIDETLIALKSTAKKMLRGRIAEVSAAELRQFAAEFPLLLRQSFRYAVQHRAYNPPDAAVHLRVHCEQEPLSSSSITLSPDRDRLGLLRTRLDWRISDHELASVQAFVAQAAKSLSGVARITPHAALREGGDALRAICNDSNHHMGGMRMDASPTRGVVTPDLRLHGTANCYICSAAVFPTSGFSNPTHTVLALAMRLADHLAQVG